MTWVDPYADAAWKDVVLPVRYLHGSLPPLLSPDDIDEGIRRWVNLLRFHGIETSQSCQGGKGHSYPEPTVDFRGDRFEGFYAVSIALRAGEMDGLRPWALRRTWHLSTEEPDELGWQLVLRAEEAAG